MPSWSEFPPPLPLLHAMRKVRTLRFGGVSPLLPPWLHARVLCCIFEVTPSLHIPHMGCAHCWVGGYPSSFVPWLHARGACCRGWGSPLGGTPPSPTWLGITPLPLLHILHGDSTLIGGFHPFALLVRGSPPSISCMPCAGSARCSGNAPTSPSWSGDPLHSLSCMQCTGSARCLGGEPLSPSWSSPLPILSLS